MSARLRDLFRTFRSDQSGQFSLWTVMLAFPVLLSASIVVDVRTAEAHRSNIQQALDVTSIAVASNNQITNTQKVQMANSVFENNYQGSLPVNLDITVTDDIIEMNANAEMPTSVRGALGQDKIAISQVSRASMQQKNTICVLALAPEGRDRVTFEQGADFDAPTCAVQANSADSYAMRARSTHTPKAKSFCSTGGALGNYDPPVKGECHRIPDPYVELKIPQPGKCVRDSLFDKGLKKHMVETSLTGESTLTNWEENRLIRKYGVDLVDVEQSDNIIPRSQLLRPGTYCGGLTISGPDVLLRSGTYIIKDGPLTIKNGSILAARGVTFVMHGENAVVRIEKGARVYIRAPKRGDLAGIAFTQDVSSMKETKTYPNGLNLLRSGGQLNVIGTLYFPTQAIDVSGESRIGARSPATSFIAYEVAFAGTTKATIGVDHVAAGLPPILPIADDAARLLK